MSLLPSVDDSTIHMYLGTRQERMREKKLIQDIEKEELGLHTESRKGFEERLQKQKEAADRLAAPFPRRVVERKAKHDILDIRLAQKQRQGPLPVDEEVAEENEILAKQIQKLRQTGVHLLQGGGGTVNLSASGAGFFGQGERQQQQQLFGGSSSAAYHYDNNDTSQQQGKDNNNNTFLTSAASFGAFSSNSASQVFSQQQQQNPRSNKNAYAGDVLFRPGRMTQNLEPSDFWLYTRQKVTQRTLGTHVLQHPVVVGQSTDAASLKELLLQSPIATIIKKKIASLLAQTTNRTRCGILFDLLSTRNIIVSGVPNIVGQIIYEHVADTIGVEHSALKFVFVGITDNSNCCAARDVFCQNKSLNGKSISSTKRGFEALDNVHTFAVAPPGGFETLLGPAALANELLKEEEESAKLEQQMIQQGASPSQIAAAKKKNKANTQHVLNRSSPLGMRPWHSAMKKDKPKVQSTADPLLQTLAQQNQQQSDNNNSSSNNNNYSTHRKYEELMKNGEQQHYNDGSVTFLTQNTSNDNDGDDLNTPHNNTNMAPAATSTNNEDDEGNPIVLDDETKKYRKQIKDLREIENALSPLPSVTHDDLLAAFDPRDLKYLPNISGKKSEMSKRWEQNELKHMNDILVGPCVKLSKMTKRYNTQTPSATMMKKRMKMTPTTFSSSSNQNNHNEEEIPALRAQTPLVGENYSAGGGESESRNPQRKSFTVGHEKFTINPRGTPKSSTSDRLGASTPNPVSSMAWR